MSADLLEVRDVERRFGGARRLFGGRSPVLHAVRGLSLALREEIGRAHV